MWAGERVGLKISLDNLFTRSKLRMARLKVRLRTWRRDRGLTQEELAKKARVTKFYISQLETGLRDNPSLPVLRRLAKALGVSAGELLE
jgi:XRE family transcriptional regulator of biofilm formation